MEEGDRAFRHGARADPRTSGHDRVRPACRAPSEAHDAGAGRLPGDGARVRGRCGAGVGLHGSGDVRERPIVATAGRGAGAGASRKGVAAISSEPPGDARQAALPERIDELARAGGGAFSASTERALRSDLAIFAAWCAGEGAEALPARPEALAGFVEAMAASRAPATVRRYVTSVSIAHRLKDLADPSKTGEVRLALKRMHRSKGRRQEQARGLTFGLRNRLIAAAGGRLIDARNRALVALAYDTLLRRAEAAAASASGPASRRRAGISRRRPATWPPLRPRARARGAADGRGDGRGLDRDRLHTRPHREPDQAPGAGRLRAARTASLWFVPCPERTGRPASR